MECLGRYTVLVMTFAILSGGMNMRDEHGMLREVYISCHDFCHTFRWCGNEGGQKITRHLKIGPTLGKQPQNKIDILT